MLKHTSYKSWQNCVFSMQKMSPEKLKFYTSLLNIYKHLHSSRILSNNAILMGKYQISANFAAFHASCIFLGKTIWIQQIHITYFLKNFCNDTNITRPTQRKTYYLTYYQWIFSTNKSQSNHCQKIKEILEHLNTRYVSNEA